MTSAFGRLGGGPDGSRPPPPPAATALASGTGLGRVGVRQQPGAQEQAAGQDPREDRERRQRPRGRRAGVEVAGPVGGDRRPVFADGVEQPAEQRERERDRPEDQRPAAEDEPGDQERHRHRDEQRAERRGRDVHAGRRRPWARQRAGWRHRARRQGGAASRDHGGRGGRQAVVVAQELAAPVEQRDPQGDQRRRQPAPAERPGRRRASARRTRRGAGRTSRRGGGCPAAGPGSAGACRGAWARPWRSGRSSTSGTGT